MIVKDSATVASDADLRSEQRLCRRGSEQHDDVRLYRGELGLPPLRARPDLGRVGLLVETHLAGGGPLEVLDRIGDVDAVAIDSRLVEHAVEELPGGPDEGMAVAILAVAGLLAHEHQASVGRALTEHRLGRPRVEFARRAPGRLAPKIGEVGPAHALRPSHSSIQMSATRRVTNCGRGSSPRRHSQTT